MAYKEPKPQEQGKGSLFINDYKKEPKHPDYRGTINIGGYTEYIAAWGRMTEEGFFIGILCDKSKVNIKLQIEQSKSNDKAPDYKGKFVYNSEKYNISGWINVFGTTPNETRYISLKVEKEGENSGNIQGMGNSTPPTGFPTAGNMNVFNNPYPMQQAPASQPQAQQYQAPQSSEDDLPF